VYLTKQLRGAGISTLLLPDMAKKSLESQFSRNDELGIPYTVVLNDASLKNGIVGLRSRDTTLKVSAGHTSSL
jgi:DNA polymerase gamma 2